jgi:UDP-N-acetyl-D-glucosamine dehydrogenase
MRVSVIGQGYVGLTVSVGAALAGHEVIGFDVNESLVGDLLKGKTFVPGIKEEQILELIRNKLFIPTSNPELLSEAEIVIIAVPTPLSIDRNPDLTFIESALKIIKVNIQVPALIINESTSYPGTLRNVISSYLEKNTNIDYLYAAAPERVDPGNKEWVLENTPRVIGGLTIQATNLATSFYSTFCKSVIKVESPEVAEASKLLENTFRQINIAFANEFAEISRSLGFSAHSAISAAATKPFGFMPFYPSIGVGGHCIPVDPTYLSFIAGKAGMKARFIELANETNFNIHKKITQWIQNYIGKSLDGLNIQLAGISYKPDVPDMRESPAIELIYELRRLGARVKWHDPLIESHNNESSSPIDPNIDIGLVVTPHKILDLSLWKLNKTFVLDLSSGSTNLGWKKFL